MLRTQIQLEERQAAALKRFAAERGISMAELIRRAVDAMLASAPEEEVKRRARAAGGAFSSGSRDTSAEHDRYLAAAFDE